MQLRAEKITRSYLREGRRIQILEETDLCLKPGNLYILQGRSGSGKTTLLHILCGIHAPSSGKVYLENGSDRASHTDLYAMKDSALSRYRSDHFGIIPQGVSPVASLTALENVMLPATVYKSDVKAGGLADRARALLAELGIEELADALPGELSGGELRRVAIARALMKDPQVIFADEPTSDLDEENTADVFRILKEAAQTGKTVLAVSHKEAALAYADVLLRMNGGHLEAV